MNTATAPRPGGLAKLHRETSDRLAKQSLPKMLDMLDSLGFSWSDIARISGCSPYRLRKQRDGGSAADVRRCVADFAAVCEIAREQYHVDDIAAWMEAPLRPEASVTAVDLAVARRFDLILRLVSGRSTPEQALDVFDPGWCHRHTPTVEVFTAPDGLPGLRLTENTA